MSVRSNKAVRILVLFAFCALAALGYPWLKGRGAIQESPVALSWKPNRAPDDAQYVGSAKCVACHSDKASQQATAMGKALEPAADCKILIAHPLLTYKQGPYSYRIAREGGRSVYSVTDGVNTISEPILYGFGQGKSGQTYVLQHEGALYESRLSFYEGIQGLDITLGAPRDLPKSLGEALGRRMHAGDARDCFGCHSTAAATRADLKLDRLVAGVTCESCHGPGEKHLAAIKAGDMKHKQIFNPAVFDAEDMNNFCGSCHRTWEDAVLLLNSLRRISSNVAINGIRFQPYRITNSKCYDGADRRISCTACHDPHKNVEANPVFYDSKCAACHTEDAKAAGKIDHKAKLCPVGKQKCVSCHMPKYELPGSHFKFTDHQIRVARPNEPFPE
jgi:hypothetical protein